MWRAFLMTRLVGRLVAGLVGCQGGSTQSTSATVPRGYGVGVEGIDRCIGSVLPPDRSGFVAGEVVVFRDGHGEASDTVAKGREYRFALLPGSYELVGHYLPPPTSPVNLRASPLGQGNQAEYPQRVPLATLCR